MVKGNPARRPINRDEPTPPKPATFDPPPPLSAVAAEFWRRTAPILDGMGVLTTADSAAFERMAECYAEIRHCQIVLEIEGSVYETRTAMDGVMIRQRPEVARLADADRRFKGYLGEFGLTPAARTKIKVDLGRKADPLDQYFG